jgi:hypothetical protein
VVAANWNRWAIDKALQKAPKTAVKQQNSTTTRQVHLEGEQTQQSTTTGTIADFGRFKTDIYNAYSRSINSLSPETKDSNRKTFERLKQVAEEAGYIVTTSVPAKPETVAKKMKRKDGTYYFKDVVEYKVKVTLTKNQTA